MGWYEDMEQAEQEYDARLEDEARAYQQGRADAIDEIKNIISNYHAHIDDDAMADIFSDLEFLRRKTNDT